MRPSRPPVAAYVPPAPDTEITPRPVPWDGPAYSAGLIEHADKLASGKAKPADWPLVRLQVYFVLELALRQTYGLTLGPAWHLEPAGLMHCTLDRLRSDENEKCDYAKTLLRKGPTGWPVVDLSSVLGGFLHDTCYLIARAGLAHKLSPA